MRHRTVHAVMTHRVVTAHPRTPFKEVVELLHGQDVTAVPVVDEQNRPVGMVSEFDLLGKEAALPDPEGRRGEAFLGTEHHAAAATAGEVMTTPAITAHAGWSVPETARLMRSAQVKRLPVVDDTGVLVGIVSRGDLLKIFLRSDDAIHDEVVHDMLGQTLRLAPRDVDVAVHDGVVNLTGKLPYRSLVAITEQLCRSVDGVVAVHQTLGFTEDDTTSEQTTSAARSDGHTY